MPALASSPTTTSWSRLGPVERKTWSRCSRTSETAFTAFSYCGESTSSGRRAVLLALKPNARSDDLHAVLTVLESVLAFAAAQPDGTPLEKSSFEASLGELGEWLWRKLTVVRAPL